MFIILMGLVYMDEFINEALNYDTNMLVLFVDKNYTKNRLFREIDKEYNGRLLKECKEDKFEGKFLQRFCFRLNRKAKRLCLMGYGDKKLDKKTLNALAGRAAQLAKKSKFTECAFIYPLGIKLSPHEIGFELVYASDFAVYEFSLKTEDKKNEKEKIEFDGISILCPGKMKRGVNKGMEEADAVSFYNSFARDLVNLSPSMKYPERLANMVVTEAKKMKIKTKVLGMADFKKLGMDGIASVGKGSRYEPKLVILEYTGRKSKGKPICFVGKGMTFDSGGLDIKDAKGMETMKCDMSGAAAVVSTIFAAAELKLKKNIVGIIGLAENMPGENAYKPGDILKAYNGKTIEVLNTDAEGRVVLSDCLSYAVKHYKPKYVLDYATLTGAMVVALGTHRTGVFSNDQNLANKILLAGENTLEYCWQMPIDKEYEELIESDIADVRNVGKERDAGSITAALFLQKFIGDTKWAHLDIAGTAFHEKSKPYRYKGASGVGVRLNTELLKKLR